MDFKMLLHGIDLEGIENQLKEIIELVKAENKNVSLLQGEDNIYILLDIKKDDVIAYRVTTGITEIENKKYIEVKRTLGKWNLNDLKTLIGEEGSKPIESTLKKLLPIVDGFITLTKLHKNEKKISIQLDIKEKDVTAYQIVLAIFGEKETGLKLVVNRILGKYDLNEYIKTV